MTSRTSLPAPRRPPEVLISVVVPTRGRPELLGRALDSVFRQTLSAFEVIVVVDGPDLPTMRALNEISDRRLRVIPLAVNVGGSEARNIGVDASRGRWIAFLDDDDEWMPQKLSLQLAVAQASREGRLIVASKFVERTERSQRIVPTRLPAENEQFSDYLFSRRGWSSAEGFLQTSTWFVSKQLLLDLPFTPGLKRCQDIDWLLHATAIPETKVIVIPQPLAIFHHDERSRVSRTSDWEFLLEWASKNRGYFSPRAYSFFIATFCMPSAAKQGASLKTRLFLLRTCIATGSATPKCLLLFIFCWGFSESRRRQLRNFLHRTRSRVDGFLRGIPALVQEWSR